MSKPTRRSVAIVIHRDDPDTSEILVVRRPADDVDLPNIWGLPAATLTADEAWADAVRRAGRQKLGLDLRPLSVIGEGAMEREGYTLRMRLYEVEARGGDAAVPQPHHGVTQYTAWNWGRVEELVEGARLGSLCCRLMLESAGAEWREPQA